MVPVKTHTENLVKYQFLITLFLIISCAPQAFGISKNRVQQDEKFTSIHSLKDNRDSEGLSEFFMDPDPQIRELAFEAMGSVQDTLSIDAIFYGLSDLNPDVRSAAGFSIGQTIRLMTNPDPVLELKLIRAIASETDPMVAKELFISLGTAYKNPQTDFLSNYQTTNPIILEGISWGIYRAGLNGYFNEPLIKRAFQFLQPDNSKSIRLGAAHFFSRTKYLPIDKYEMDLIKLISKETDPEIRMAIVLALSKIESGSTVSLLSSLIEHDIDERVRINAIRALGKIGGLKAEEPIRRSIFDENINVSIAASEYFETAENIFFPEEILNILDRVNNWRVRIVLCKSLLIHNYKLKEISTKLISQFENSENIYEKAWILNALSSSSNYIQFIKKETFNSTFPIIRTYGMNGLCDLILKEDLDSSSKSLLVDILIEGIKLGDPVVASLAAGTLSDPKLEMKNQIHDLQFLYNALENLTLPQDYEAAAEIIHAIEYFEGSESLENIIDLPTVPIDWEIYQELPQKPHAIITTNRGTISVQLFNKEAPGTVTNFSKLSTSGFYNGKTFHRVVPNFVVQGGCPRGDGWGSSDPTIRSEFSRLNYKTGFVGMASSGKDTESCQWFITHSPTPHLDGRYTIFGKVISGMDVVNQIQVGDKIESIKIK